MIKLAKLACEMKQKFFGTRETGVRCGMTTVDDRVASFNQIDAFNFNRSVFECHQKFSRQPISVIELLLHHMVENHQDGIYHAGRHTLLRKYQH